MLLRGSREYISAPGKVFPRFGVAPQVGLRTPTLRCGHFSGLSHTRGVFFDFEVGGHDGAYKGRVHMIVPFVGRKNGNGTEVRPCAHCTAASYEPLRSSMTTSTGKPWGTSHELNPVCKPRHRQNLYLNELAPRESAHLVLANLIAKKKNLIDRHRHTIQHNVLVLRVPGLEEGVACISCSPQSRLAWAFQLLLKHNAHLL